MDFITYVERDTDQIKTAKVVLSEDHEGLWILEKPIDHAFFIVNAFINNLRVQVAFTDDFGLTAINEYQQAYCNSDDDSGNIPEQYFTGERLPIGFYINSEQVNPVFILNYLQDLPIITDTLKRFIQPPLAKCYTVIEQPLNFGSSVPVVKITWNGSFVFQAYINGVVLINTTFEPDESVHFYGHKIDFPAGAFGGFGGEIWFFPSIGCITFDDLDAFNNTGDAITLLGIKFEWLL